MLKAFNEAKLRFESSDEIDFNALVLDVIREKSAHHPIRVLDIGGGKFPLLPIRALPGNVEYAVCDVSPEELSKTPPEYHAKYCFDICGNIPGNLGQFDIVFSRMLAEHVVSGKKLYGNVFRLLRPSGVGLMYHPTLFALPFVVNKIIPHVLAKKIVHFLYPRRKTRDSVFPAHYSWCTGIGFIENRRRFTIGFDEVGVIRQYNHGYWRRFPYIGKMAAIAQKFYRTNRLTLFCSFAVFYVSRRA